MQHYWHTKWVQAWDTADTQWYSQTIASRISMILHLPSPTRFSHWASAKDGGKFMADPKGSIGGCMASCACCNLRGKFLQKTCQGQNIVFLGGMVIRPSMGIQGNRCINSYIHGLIWMITWKLAHLSEPRIRVWNVTLLLQRVEQLSLLFL